MPFERERTVSSTSASSSFGANANGRASPLPALNHRHSAAFTASSRRSRTYSNVSGTTTIQPSQYATSKPASIAPDFLSPVRGHKNSFTRQQQQHANQLRASRQAAMATSRPEEVNLLSLQPTLQDGSVDSLFVHFNVREVRTVEERASKEAEAKREELRTMVGDRYRDLLGAADSIVRMRKASETLLDDLNEVKRHCSRVKVSDQIQQTPSKQKLRHSRMLTGIHAHNQNEQQNSLSPYTLATLVKLLLDCPEYIWKSIESQDYLAAARLEALARAIYRDLAALGSTNEGEDSHVGPANGSDDINGPIQNQDVLSAFPLVEKQSEVLHTIGHQISRRARSALWKTDLTTSKMAETLIAILMLENLNTSDCVDLALAQRQLVYSQMLESCGQCPPTDLATYLIKLLRLILMTLHEIRTIFGNGENSQSPFSQILDALQQPLSSPAKISTPSFGQLVISSILHPLPNSHNLLRYVPPSISDFAPYVESADQMDRQQLESRCTTWFRAVSERLISGIETLLHIAPTVKTISQIREQTIALLSSAKTPEARSLDEIVQTALGSRAQSMLRDKLNELSTTLTTDIADGLASLPSSSADLKVSALVFQSDPNYATEAYVDMPSRPGKDHYSRYRSKLVSKIKSRTPHLYKCMEAFEQGLASLRKDLVSWTDGTLTGDSVFKSDFADSLSHFIVELRTWLAERMSDASDVPRKLFIARLAQAIAKRNSPLALLTRVVTDKDILQAFRESQGQLQDKALQAWKARALDIATTLLDDALAQLIDCRVEMEPVVDLKVLGPSPHLTKVLHSVVIAQDQLQEDTGFASEQDLSKALLQSITSIYDEKNRPLLMQLSWDLNLLQRLSERSTPPTSLAQITAHLQQEDLSQTIERSVDAYLISARTVLEPLRTLTAEEPVPTSATGAPSNPISAPAPPKLGARFGLLPVPPLRK